MLKRTITYLHYFQQEEYDSPRFIKWIYQNNFFDKYLSISLLLLGIIYFLFNENKSILILITTLLFAYASYKEVDPLKSAKKKLVLTGRAKRILYISLSLSLALIIAATFLNISANVFTFFYIGLIQLTPFSLALANTALLPYETKVNMKFRDSATRKLDDLNPTVIAITGSFGKTSVKHILGHILQSSHPTLITPGSVNTEMGITRVINEKLEANHKWFVVEMGAYGPGSINKLCELTPPDLGIITSIGEAHYERFKSIETVAKAKFELAQAVITKHKEARTIALDKVFSYKASIDMLNEHPKNFVICGSSEKSTYKILGISQSEHGVSVEFLVNEEKIKLDSPLYGMHHGENILLAYSAAKELGIADSIIIEAIKRTPQIRHRLEVKKQPNDILLIDDAYNSNPIGFQSAVNLLAFLAKKRSGRSIIVTPGMVELGDIHDAEHKKIATHISKMDINIVIIVNSERIPTFTSTFKEKKNHTQKQICLPTFNDANNWLALNSEPGDVILLENDLPDLFENPPKF